MAFTPEKTRSVDWQAAVVGTDETTPLFSMAKGDRVRWMRAQQITPAAASTNSTITVGDDSGADYYLASANFDPEAVTAGSIVDCAGSNMANAGGKLYTAADTIDIVYTANAATGARPKIRFTIGYNRMK